MKSLEEEVWSESTRKDEEACISCTLISYIHITDNNLTMTRK